MKNKQWRRANVLDTLWAMKWRISAILMIASLIIWLVGGNIGTIIYTASAVFLLIALSQWWEAKTQKHCLTCQCGKTFTNMIPFPKDECPKCGSAIPSELKNG